ncbi:MAG: hypothetical protein NZ693_04435 [Thermoflexales bacterium]|nr:hypothetical protein [Thermoflexales bacterium]
MRAWLWRELHRDLTTALDEGRPVLVLAPMGYGKTTLLRQVAAQRAVSCWVSLAAPEQDVPAVLAALKHLPVGALVAVDNAHLLESAPATATQLLDALRAQRLRCIVSGRWLPTSWATLPSRSFVVTEIGLRMQWLGCSTLTPPRQCGCRLGRRAGLGQSAKPGVTCRQVWRRRCGVRRCA